MAKPLLPPEPLKLMCGRPRVPDWVALTGILFVLKMGTPWEYFSQEMGCGRGMTCWRRLRDWRVHDTSGPKGIKYDRMEMLDIDHDGDLDIIPCEERENKKGLGLFWHGNFLSNRKND